MLLIIDQCIFFEGCKCPYTMRKTFHSDIIPHKGDFIEDSVWKQPCKVFEVTINYEDNTCYVCLEKETYNIPETRKDEIAHMIKLHNWEPLWEIRRGNN